MDPEDGRRIVDWARCTQCLACVEACRYGSLVASGRRFDADEIIAEVLKDRVFYETSGGGITVSGGEPLMQAEALLSLLQTSKAAGLHTVLDTSGCAPWRHFEAVLPHLDLVLFDVKHLDRARHRAATGVDNRFILENLEKLRGRVPLWIRVPLIAGFNDSEGHMESIAYLAKRAQAERISLLPYHAGGASKSAQIGRPHALPDGQPPSEEQLERLAAIVRARGLKVVIAA
jgi:pyruvate formate lyase activating enzyme